MQEKNITNDSYGIQDWTCQAMPEPKNTFRRRLRRKLFPQNYCELPEAPPTFEDVLTTDSEINIGFLDRIRILFSGRARLVSKVVCENSVGRTVTRSAFSVLGPIWLDKE